MENEVEPAEQTANQQLIENLAIAGLQKTDVATGDLTGTILKAMRIMPDAETGAYRRMTDDEYVDTLGDTEKLLFRNLGVMAERQEKALAGDVPVSEFLGQKKTDDFRIFKENQARLGNEIIGDDPDTATANTTPGIQSLNSFRDTWALTEDRERFNELQTTMGNVASSAGLLTNLSSDRYTKEMGYPGRYNFALAPYSSQAGLLSNQAILNAQTQSQTRSDIYGLGGAGLASLAYYLKPNPSTSDERLKDIKGDFVKGLDAILNLKPINFTWKKEAGMKSESVNSGFSAQQVREFIPEAVYEDPNGILVIDDRAIMAVLVNAVKELGEKVIELRKNT